MAAILTLGTSMAVLLLLYGGLRPQAITALKSIATRFPDRDVARARFRSSPLQPAVHSRGRGPATSTLRESVLQISDFADLSSGCESATIADPVRSMKTLRNRGGATVKTSGSIRPDMTIDEIMRQWPATVAVVLGRKMLCTGCPIGPFHTVTDACREHRVNETRFLVDLELAVRGGG
ncbi:MULTISPECIES: DUF1858 domain-containing protein [unclassified Mesorhizobium]|uniref:DUF1858 domain-containing protein n=1 Tax=unclassified Mesorhizobium TaxID=325217 RepID=UPI00333951CA